MLASFDRKAFADEDPFGETKEETDAAAKLDRPVPMAIEEDLQELVCLSAACAARTFEVHTAREIM